MDKYMTPYGMKLVWNIEIDPNTKKNIFAVSMKTFYRLTDFLDDVADDNGSTQYYVVDKIVGRENLPKLIKISEETDMKIAGNNLQEEIEKLQIEIEEKQEKLKKLKELQENKDILEERHPIVKFIYTLHENEGSFPTYITDFCNKDFHHFHKYVSEKDIVDAKAVIFRPLQGKEERDMFIRAKFEKAQRKLAWKKRTENRD